MSSKLILLDGHSLAHRAFYALPLLTNTHGEYTNAVLGFATMLFRLLEEEKPTHIAVAFDTSAPTFRHERFDSYKAQRKRMPDEMRPQMTLIRELVEAFGITKVEKPGYEADDVIGTLARNGSSNNAQVYIVTGDRDALQLVDSVTTVMLTRKGISEVDLFTPQAVFEKYGITPEQVPDMKGLMGDTSDNIPGVPGVGEKTAVKLIQEFGTVENLLSHLDSLKAGKMKTTLESNVDLARLSKELATIDVSVPVDITIEDMVFATPPVEKIRPILERLEFKSLLKRLDDGKIQFMLGQDSSVDSLAVTSSSSAQTTVESGEFQMVTSDEFCQALESIALPGGYLVEYIVSGSATRGVLELVAIRSEGTGAKAYIFDTKVCGRDLANDLSSFFQSENIFKTFHDAKALVTLLKSHGCQMAGLRDDTAVAAYLLNSTARSYSLDDVSFGYVGLRVPEWKFGKNDPKLSDYNIADTASRRLQALDCLSSALAKRIQEDGMDRLYRDVEIPLIDVLSEMEANGLKVDIQKLGQLSQTLSARASELESRIHDLAGLVFNINSTKQLAEILFVKLGLPPKKKTATGFSTDVDVLEELAEEHELPALILDYRQVQKLKSTYADALAGLTNPETGRVHTTFNQVSTATGRLSSTDPNLQNIPIRSEEGRKVREVFVPGREGWVLMAADYSQVELRILAHISQDPTLMESFSKGEDIHTRTASEVFGIPQDQVTKSQRDAAKAVNFGIIYGQTGYGLSRGLGIPRKQAQEYIDNYLGRYPGVKEYIRATIDTARDLGYVSTMMGRRRYLPDISSRKWTTRQFAERTAMNTPIQGSAADIMKAAMVDVYHALKESKYKTRLLLQVHDEIVLEVPPSEIDDVRHLLRSKMENVTNISVPLQVDVKLGSNWRDVVSSS